jgi:hypothetical protein
MRNFGLILTALILLNLSLFLIFISQGQGEDHIDENLDVSFEIESPEDALEKFEVGDVVAIDDQMHLPSFDVSLKYERHLPTYTYFVVENDFVNIYSGPSLSEKVIYRAKQWDKLNYIESVLIKAEEETVDRWLHVTWKIDDEPYYGFVKSDDVSRRFFNFEKMEKVILKADEYFKKGRLTFINNYKNLMGSAPLYQGGTVDKEGNRRSQSAPGYIDLSNMEDFIYIEDGTLVRYLYPSGDFIRVEVVDTGKNYYVPGKFIPKDRQIRELNRVIVIDRNNQNQGVFEKIDNNWTLISYTLATTGATGRYAQPTSLGYYYAIEKRNQFYYYEDGTTRIQGYAPYAIRFNGGAYVHGVPVNYLYSEKGERITPPKIEYSKSIGTVPLSHKCVRNYTSHAKFLYDWYREDETIIIVIE